MQPLIDSIQIEGSTPSGACIPYAGSVAPPGFTMADGTAKDSIANPEFAPLFTIIGTTYGGTGASNFNVPNLLGRTVAGVDGGTFTNLGTLVGAENVTLVIGNLPAHDHPGSVSDTEPNHVHSGGTTTGGNQGGGGSASHDPTTTGGGGSHAHSLTIASQGSDTPFSIIQPTISLNYIIAL